jgi:alanyl-tRNA synthetase
VGSKARAKVEQCQKSLAKQRKVQFAAKYAERVAELELKLSDNAKPYHILDVEMDAKSAKPAMDACTKSGKAVLLFCVDDDDEDVLCYAHVPKQEDSVGGGLRADEWVKAVVGVGGKSGGSATVARGSVSRSYLDSAQTSAKHWASKFYS